MNFESVRKKVKDFEEDLGIKFDNLDLLIIALTHPSSLHSSGLYRHQSNQRLEFLGDAVVGLVIGELFYHYSSNWDDDLKWDDLVWPDVKKLMNNYKGFLTINPDKYRIRLLTLIEESS